MGQKKKREVAKKFDVAEIREAVQKHGAGWSRAMDEEAGIVVPVHRHVIGSAPVPTVTREAYDSVVSQLSDLLVEVRRWRAWGDADGRGRAVHTGQCSSDAPFFAPDCGSLGCSVEKARKHNEARGLK